MRGPALGRLRRRGAQQLDIREVMAVVVTAFVPPVTTASAAAVATATAPVPRVVVPGVPLVPLALRGGARWVTAAKLASRRLRLLTMSHVLLLLGVDTRYLAGWEWYLAGWGCYLACVEVS